MFGSSKGSLSADRNRSAKGKRCKEGGEIGKLCHDRAGSRIGSEQAASKARDNAVRVREISRRVETSIASLERRLGVSAVGWQKSENGGNRNPSDLQRPSATVGSRRLPDVEECKTTRRGGGGGGGFGGGAPSGEGGGVMGSKGRWGLTSRNDLHV